MGKSAPFVITISRQLGSGGAYIGQQLATRLKIYYADREIISQTAKQLSALEGEVEARDEKKTLFWQAFAQSMLQSFAFSSPAEYVPPPINVLTDSDIFHSEAEVIERIARGRSAVIIGRCGSYILRAHPSHTRIFLYGDAGIRNKRIQKLYSLSEPAAASMIAKSDGERASYNRTFTGMDWADARQYDLCIDTGKLEIDRGVDLIMKYLELS